MELSIELLELSPEELETARERVRALAYKKWCDDNGEIALSAQKLAQRLKERGLSSDRDKAGKYWNGITLQAKRLEMVEQGSLAV